MVCTNPVSLLCIIWTSACEVVLIVCFTDEPRVRFVAVSSGVYPEAAVTDRVRCFDRSIICRNVVWKFGAK